MADRRIRNCPFCGKRLDGAEEVRIDHLSEAIQYRSVDREFWR